MKVLMGKWSRVEVKYISDNDILKFIGRLAFNQITRSSNPDYKFQCLIDKINPNSITNKLCFIHLNDEYEFSKRFVGECLSILSLSRVDEIEGKLAGPDENILPLSKIE